LAVETCASATRSRPSRLVDVLRATRFGRAWLALIRPFCAEIVPSRETTAPLQVGAGAIDLLGARAAPRLHPAAGRSGALHLQNGDQLASFHPVADIDIDALHEAGDLRVDVDFLIRSEFRRDREHAENVAARATLATATVGTVDERDCACGREQAVAQPTTPMAQRATTASHDVYSKRIGGIRRQRSRLNTASDGTVQTCGKREDREACRAGGLARR
jgi:hypothetical protein